MNTKKIFLAGGGDEVQSRAVDDLYGETIGHGAKVLYVPIAWPNPNEYAKCFDWFSKAYERFYFDVEMVTDVSLCTLEYLLRFDSIYIGGGNTFSLLKTMKDTGLADLLLHYIDAGRVVYGGSAGAIILGKDISTAAVGKCSDINHVGITDLSGLDVAEGHTIHCHYAGEMAELQKIAFERKLTILAIPEDGGVFIDNGTLKTIGEVPIF